MSTWKTAFGARDDLQHYGDNGLALFALALRFGVDDLDTIASDAITDGSNDKKCDMVYINNEENYAVLAQCYWCTGNKREAPANKASDLNTALGWLLQRDIDDIPLRLRSAAAELRSSLNSGNISKLFVWYVHNLPESENVKQELVTVENTAVTAISQTYKKKVDVTVLEVGESILSDWYSESLSPILVNEEFMLSVCGGYEQNGPKWKSYSTAIDARFLYRAFKKHNTKIFSANIRDYLGSRASDSNINFGIRKTVEESPADFWVYNNGLTILTNSYEILDGAIKCTGLSIVNGAQTTGAIGSLRKLPPEEAKVQARFVATNNDEDELIHSIIRFNNSQNKVEASDFRSNDKYQKRLKKEFESIDDTEYEGGRRGGASDAIKRRPNLLPSYTVGQALACFHQDPVVAYNQKTAIWVDDNLYSRYFNDKTSASHILCAYSLLKAVEAKKYCLLDKQKKVDVTTSEDDYITYFRKRGSIFLLSTAIAHCLEIFTDKAIPNMFRITFGSDLNHEEALDIWRPIVDVTVPFSVHLNDGLGASLSSKSKVNEAIRTFRSLVQSTAASNKSIYNEFSGKIRLK